MSDLIFVYGSLRKDFSSPASEILDNHSEYVGEATFQGKLYKVDWYPGVVPSDDPDDIVFGEVYKITEKDHVLPALDRYEGCSPEDPEPHAFVRKQRLVTLDNGGTIDAWIYLYTRPVSGKDRIDSGDYLKKQD